MLERICSSEDVSVDDAVYPLVIRAGGGSPRDSLSVLDQLLAGAEGNRVDYQRALALLGAFCQWQAGLQSYAATSWAGSTPTH